jgi:pimeloyl-ACP methyl ester carboxylesterase
MPAQTPIRPADLHGAQRLAIDATLRVTDLVEAMHLNIARAPWILGETALGRTRGITGLVYGSIRTITAGVGSTLDAVLGPALQLLEAQLESGASHPGREAVLAAVNGVLGDHLADSGNPLAIPMRLRHRGRALILERESLGHAFPEASGRLLVLAHGLCMNDLQWRRKGHDHGAALARDSGYQPLYLHYNSGRHVSTNGEEFSALLETLLEQWPVPVEEITILGHSMGGLLARSACRHAELAQLQWRSRLRKIVFLGTPHHGAPLERHGHGLQRLVGISPYTAPLARLGMIRSAGITDLRHGNVQDQDWQELDRFGRPQDARQPLPLPQGVACHAVAATNGPRVGDLTDTWIGDGLVPVASALGRHADPRYCLDFDAARQSLHYETNHWDLLDSPAVYERIAGWLQPG